MKHSHYFKPIPTGMTHVDVYAVLKLFNVTDPCRQHAVKKLLCAGQRGAKDAAKDDQEVIDTMERKLALDAEFLERKSVSELIAEAQDAGVTGEKPWYPDGRKWVEVPDWCMVCPVAPDVVVGVLLKGNREERLEPDMMLTADEWEWGNDPERQGRIVAYTLDAPETKEKLWYPDGRKWIEVPDDCMESPLADGVMCSILYQSEREDMRHLDIFCNHPNDWWRETVEGNQRIVAYTTEEYHGR